MPIRRGQRHLWRPSEPGVIGLGSSAGRRRGSRLVFLASGEGLDGSHSCLVDGYRLAGATKRTSVLFPLRSRLFLGLGSGGWSTGGWSTGGWCIVLLLLSHDALPALGGFPLLLEGSGLGKLWWFVDVDSVATDASTAAELELDGALSSLLGLDGSDILPVFGVVPLLRGLSWGLFLFDAGHLCRVECDSSGLIGSGTHHFVGVEQRIHQVLLTHLLLDLSSSGGRSAALLHALPLDGFLLDLEWVAQGVDHGLHLVVVFLASREARFDSVSKSCDGLSLGLLSLLALGLDVEGVGEFEDKRHFVLLIAAAGKARLGFSNMCLLLLRGLLYLEWVNQVVDHRLQAALRSVRAARQASLTFPHVRFLGLWSLLDFERVQESIDVHVRIVLILAAGQARLRLSDMRLHRFRGLLYVKGVQHLVDLRVVVHLILTAGEPCL
mmetsp:Transcript_47220/g.101069  ORF Transcript_47220/g.101069 Transcript_47220/m.101069 type:complete len:438 (-) Transcript_47220:632-1945(-)